MSKKNRRPIPVNLLSGPLGVGKTTTINHLLSQRPEGEKWAVLVNEYGLVGLDAALMEADPTTGSSKSVDIREVAGGCICCSAGFMFEVSLVVLLQRRPDRLLIEPTGLAALSGILDTLDRPGIREAVDVRSVICLLDPERFERDLARPELQDQVEAADVLLANRSDVASPSSLKQFESWAQAIFPPKKHIGQFAHGQIPIALLDLVSNRDSAVPRSGHRHGTDHEHEHDHHEHEHEHEHAHNHHPKGAPETQEKSEPPCNADNPFIQRSHHSASMSTLGWICWEGLVFDAEQASNWLRAIAKNATTRRVKAVMRTTEGWWGFNFTQGTEEVRPSGYRRDSRIEVILEGETDLEPQNLEQSLRQCVSVSDGSKANEKSKSRT